MRQGYVPHTGIENTAADKRAYGILPFPNFPALTLVFSDLPFKLSFYGDGRLEQNMSFIFHCAYASNDVMASHKTESPITL